MIKKILENKDKNLKLTTLGFTLIELLAVIVILAIIALIATPIVLNIIEDSKKSAFVQTGNGIVDAAEYYYMNEMSDGVKPTENKVFTFDESKRNIEGLEFDGEIPQVGNVTVNKEGQIQLVAHNNQYCIIKGYEDNEITIKDYDGNCEISNEENTLATICTYDSTNGVAEKTAGAKYTCEVKEGTSYNFYVLTTPEEGAETINLIMDRNIYYSFATDTSSEVTSTNTENVAWYAAADDNSFGPVTAMNYLYNATKDWTNIPDMVMNYTDEGGMYGTIVTTDGVTKITKKDGTTVTVLTDKEGYTNLKARMPYKSEVSDYDGTNAYLYDNLRLSCYDNEDDLNNVSCDEASYISGVQAEGITHIRIHGYGTLSSSASRSVSASRPDLAWFVDYTGYVYDWTVDLSVSSEAFGVRPVITLEI